MSRSVEVTESVGMSRSVDVKLTESTEVSCRISEPALVVKHRFWIAGHKNYKN